MPLELAASLRAILESYVSDGGMSLDMAAELTGTTRRTLQRRLRASGLTFSELQMQVRFRAITQLLSDSSIPIRDVAHEAGFDDQSHFARSFRRIAGVSPRQYRRAAGQA